jgi:hypothetical protein
MRVSRKLDELGLSFRLLDLREPMAPQRHMRALLGFFGRGSRYCGGYRGLRE